MYLTIENEWGLWKEFEGGNTGGYDINTVLTYEFLKIKLF